ncbi:MAG: hypothetical protein HYT73_02235 [Candidatus Aenigmarchaeota archaeon]|nr:hypothetical protein [Candidatus Aenigmarchaeota archaeon]
MTQMSQALHHFHRRKRIYKRHERYPSPNKWKRLMDKLIFAVGVLGPIMTIPQLLKIFAERNAAGLSIVTFVSYLILDFFWLAYGIMHKEKPIIITFAAWILLNIIIIAGIMMYG